MKAVGCASLGFALEMSLSGCSSVGGFVGYAVRCAVGRAVGGAVGDAVGCAHASWSQQTTLK